jgi:hypothetical protein
MEKHGKAIVLNISQYFCEFGQNNVAANDTQHNILCEASWPNGQDVRQLNQGVVGSYPGEGTVWYL